MQTPSYSRQRKPKHLVMILIFILLAVLLIFLYLFEKTYSSIGSENQISEITTLAASPGYERNTDSSTVEGNQKTQMQEIRDEDLLQMAFITTPEAYSGGIINLEIEAISKECTSLSTSPEFTIIYTITNISNQSVFIHSDLQLSDGLSNLDGDWLKFFYNEEKQLFLSYADVFDPGFTLSEKGNPYTEIEPQQPVSGQLSIAITGEYSNSEDDSDGFSPLPPGDYFLKLVLRGARAKDGNSIGYIASNLIPICLIP